jgi:hypothetical protein
MQNTPSSWLRHLNPFHFEAKYLVYSALANLMLAFLLISCFTFMLYFLPKIRHAIHVTDTKSEQVSDAKSLHQTIHGEAVELDDETNSLYGIMIAFAGLSLLAMTNSFYLYRSHRLISVPPQKI